MSIDWWIDKENVVHIYNGILLSHIKEGSWVICRDMGGPTAYHTEWKKSEKNEYHILTPIHVI